MRLIKPMSLGLLGAPDRIARRYIYTIGGVAAFRLDDPTRLIMEQAMWKAATPLLGGGVLDAARLKPRAEVLLAGNAHAPQGLPVQAMDVGFRVGKVARRFRVFGDRHWVDGATGMRPSPPQPFLTMPLNAQRAFGGPGFAENPAGLGHGARDLLRLGAPAALANIEDGSRPAMSPSEVLAPLLPGPVDIMAPSRQRMAGTYDTQWLQRDHPGLPADADPHIHQAAQSAQWNDGFFDGGEEIVLQGFRPDSQPWHSRLPGMRLRCFVAQVMEDGVEVTREVPLRIDTVWLFPEAGLGVAIHRGALPVSDPDAKDIATLMLAYERMSDPQRDPAHYQEQLRLRTDPATAGHYMLRESPLKPERSAADRARRAAAKARMREALEARMRLVWQVQTKKIEQMAGLPPGMLPIPPPDLDALPDFPMITQEEIDELDIDLGEIWEAADRMLEEPRRMLEEMQKHKPANLGDLLAMVRTMPTPKGMDNAEWDEFLATIDDAMDADKIVEKAGLEAAGDERERLEQAIRQAMNPPPRPTEQVWIELEGRILRDTSVHPLMRAFDEMPPLDMLDDVAGADQPPEGVTRQPSQPFPDIDALLAGLELGDPPPGRDPASLPDLEATRTALAEGIGRALPGLAHLPPGEALARLSEQFSSPADVASSPEAIREKITNSLADARAKVERLVLGDDFVPLRRISPAASSEAIAWDDSFAPRLLALIATLRAQPGPDGSADAGLEGRDFAHVRLPGLALPGAALSRSMWERTDLNQADFGGAALHQAVFAEAELRGARLSGATLTEANLSRARLDGAALDDTDLSRSVWLQSHAAEAVFSRATLVGIMFMQCDLGRTCFAGATLRECIFMDCDLTAVDLSGARLDRCIFMKCPMDGLRAGSATLENCAFVEAPMLGADFTSCRFRNVAVVQGKLAGASFQLAIGENLSLLGADLVGADFSGCDMPAVVLMEARLEKASFVRARMRRAIFLNAQAEGANFSGADLFEGQFRRAMLKHCNFHGASLYSADLDDVELMFADLTAANIRHTWMERPSDVA